MCPPLILRRQLALARAVGRLAHWTVWCTPDSPMNYSQRVWPIFRECPVQPADGLGTGHCPTGAHRTVRCTRLAQVLLIQAKLLCFTLSRLGEFPST
jgi:hypothetical protein